MLDNARRDLRGLTDRFTWLYIPTGGEHNRAGKLARLGFTTRRRTYQLTVTFDALRRCSPGEHP